MNESALPAIFKQDIKYYTSSIPRGSLQAEVSSILGSVVLKAALWFFGLEGERLKESSGIRSSYL